MSDTVLAALITAAAGLIVGASAAYFPLRQQRETALREAEKAHRRKAVAYLKIIAETIKGMREQLAESQIPRTFGHQFSGLLDSYKGFLQPYLGDETQRELDKLTLRIQKVVLTESADAALQSGRGVEPETLREWLADLERVEGDVRAQAARISPTESRTN